MKIGNVLPVRLLREGDTFNDPLVPTKLGSPRKLTVSDASDPNEEVKTTDDVDTGVVGEFEYRGRDLDRMVTVLSHADPLYGRDFMREVEVKILGSGTRPEEEESTTWQCLLTFNRVCDYIQTVKQAIVDTLGCSAHYAAQLGVNDHIVENCLRENSFQSILFTHDECLGLAGGSLGMPNQFVPTRVDPDLYDGKAAEWDRAVARKLENHIINLMIATGEAPSVLPRVEALDYSPTGRWCPRHPIVTRLHSQDFGELDRRIRKLPTFLVEQTSILDV